MTITMIHNHNWLGDNDLDLSELIVASFILLIWRYMFLTWCEFSKSEFTYVHRSTKLCG
jgi:hypothetical protein